MNVFQSFEKKIKEIVYGIDFENDVSALIDKISVELPRDPAHGHLATNAAMVLAKPAKKNPRELAGAIAEKLEELSEVEEVAIAGPGFINLRLTDVFWQEQLSQILKSGKNYGRGEAANGEKVNVEYVSANPTGPMHVGHCRGAVVGDALANLLEFAGYDVTKEYYVNDAGGQIVILAGSLYHRYLEALGDDVGPLQEGMYPGEYLIPPARDLVEKYGETLKNMDEQERSSLLKEIAISSMMEMIRGDLSALNIHHDVFFSERTLHERDEKNGSKIDHEIDGLRERDLVYQGRLEPPKGEKPEGWEDREQTLFRATKFGDDTDRPLKKSNGDYTYFAADVAYFADKFKRGFKRTVFVLGADHAGYAKRLEAVAKAIAGDEVALDVLFCQLVKLLRDGEPVAMGKRSGNFVTLRDVVEEVGSDAVRFMMLYRKPEAPLDFDFAKVTEQSKDNPVFYVQYAHARTCSLFRQVGEELPGLDVSDEALEKADFALLEDDGEQQLIRKAVEFPKIVEQAARSDEPHRIAFYLYELASELHSHWSKGKEKPELRFINHENAKLTLSRLALVRSLASVLASGLGIVGAAAPSEMR